MRESVRLARVRVASTEYVAVLNLALEATSAARSGRVLTLKAKNGTSCVIDEEDDWATMLKWHTHQSGRNIYFCHSFRPEMHAALHNLMLPASARNSGAINRVDVCHLDGDSLNNRRQNLRYGSHSDNVAAALTSRRRETLVNGARPLPVEESVVVLDDGALNVSVGNDD